jgi:beta-N-acetylhexosaminidase
MQPLTQQIGSLLVCGFEDTLLPDRISSLLRDGMLGGVILFARNYENIEKLKRLTSAVRDASENAVIAVDQEGGRVVRFAGDFPCFPSPRFYAERNDPDGLIHAIRVTAERLADCGVNLNLIPVCDLHPEECGHVIHSRAYSTNPEEVAEICARQVAVLQEYQLLSCAKHFPGLQSGTGDPHLLVTHSDRDIESFRSRDFVPFARVIAAGVDLVMVTHVAAAAFGDSEPATFNRRLIEEELRGRLGFAGAIITDDLEMGAVTASRSEATAASDALRAGCDMLLFGQLQTDPIDLVSQIEEQAAGDVHLRERIVAAHAVVSTLEIKRAAVG